MKKLFLASIINIFFLHSCNQEGEINFKIIHAETIPERLFKTQIVINNGCETISEIVNHGGIRGLKLDKPFLDTNNYHGLKLWKLLTKVDESYNLYLVSVYYKNCDGKSIINGAEFDYKKDNDSYYVICSLDTLEYFTIPEYKWDDIDTIKTEERKQTDLMIYKKLLNSRLYTIHQGLIGKPLPVPDAK